MWYYGTKGPPYPLDDEMAKEPHYKFKDSQIREALLETRGNLTEAAKFITSKWNDTCSRTYLKRRVEASPALLGLLEEIREEIVDRAEDNIFLSVESGDYQASVLVVRTLGKERGWVPKEEVDGKLDATAVVEAIQKGRERVRSGATDTPTATDVAEDQPSDGT